jgi:hypothetical protein
MRASEGSPSPIVVFFAALLGLGACDEPRQGFDEPPPGARPRAVPSSSVASTGLVRPPAPDAGTATRSSPLDLPTRRGLRLPPLPAKETKIAFGAGRLGILTDDALIARDTEHLETLARFPLGHPRALATLADGSLFALGVASSLRLAPDEKKPKATARLPLLPVSVLFGDRRDANRLWVLGARSTTLFGYDLSRLGSPAVPTEWIDLDAFDRRALVSLRDGSFLYSATDGFRRFWGSGHKEVVRASIPGTLAVLPGSRTDTVWVLTAEKVALYRLLEGKLLPLESAPLETMPCDAAADGELLAVLELAQPPDAPWSFVLEVFDVQGKRRFRQTLPGDESVGADWVLRLFANRRLALSAKPPLVAVGGPTELFVWAADSGASRFAGASGPPTP